MFYLGLGIGTIYFQFNCHPSLLLAIGMLVVVFLAGSFVLYLIGQDPMFQTRSKTAEYFALVFLTISGGLIMIPLLGGMISAFIYIVNSCCGMIWILLGLLSLFVLFSFMMTKSKEIESWIIGTGVFKIRQFPLWLLALALALFCSWIGLFWKVL